MRRLLPLIALASLGLAASAQDFSQVQVRATQLSPTTWMLTGAGGNLGLSVGEDSVFLIDDQYAPLAPKIKAAIAAITPKPVQFLLNTHYHFDHTGGNEAFGRAGTLIVAHDNVRRRLATDQLIGFIGANQAASPKAALPVITVPAAVSFHINGDEVHAFHVPNAHTDGDLIVHFRGSDVVHMGDTFFNGFYPFIDTAAGGTAAGMVAAADRVLALATERTKIIPGHGPLADRATLKSHRDMIATVAQRIADLRRAGRTDTEIVAAAPSADFDAVYGQGFIRPERFVLMMLAAVPR
jgi:glyoxylase-like metal-dependent hydrolase (beta-lactamase superfamily II)